MQYLRFRVCLRRLDRLGCCPTNKHTTHIDDVYYVVWCVTIQYEEIVAGRGSSFNKHDQNS